jgi:hypothetical protein
MPGRLRTASRPSRTVMSLASYEAPPLPFAAGLRPFAGAFLLVVFFVAGDRFDGFARALLSAKNFLPFATESPERRRPQFDLRTSVGAIAQVDIKDTSFGPRKDRRIVRKSLQNTD